MPRSNSEDVYRGFFDQVESEVSPDLDQVANLAGLLAKMFGDKAVEGELETAESLARVVAEKAREVSTVLKNEIEVATAAESENRQSRIACVG